MKDDAAWEGRFAAIEKEARARDEEINWTPPAIQTPGLLTDAELAMRMVQHTARVCRLVTDAMGIEP